MSNADVAMWRDAIGAAQVYGKGRYFEEGTYDLEVQKIFYKRTLVEGSAKESIIAEFKVLESSNPNFSQGSSVSSVYSFKHAGWMPRFKAMVLALVGQDPDQRIPPKAEEAVKDIYGALRSEEERKRLQLPENFLAGRKVRAEAIPGKSRGGTPVTNMKWSPVAQ